MEKDKIFFGENGHTSTHISYLANIAKEQYQKVEKGLNDIRFYTTTVGFIGQKEQSVITEGMDESELGKIEHDLNYVAGLKSFVAWCRESLKAKDALIQEARRLTNEDICKACGMSYPVAPLSYNRITTDDAVATWNIKQRNRYYYLETLCATIGAYVHPNGAYSIQREKLFHAITNPNTVDGTGRDSIIYHNEPTCSPDAVDKTFFELQNKYREYQAELNSMKHEIELAIQQDDREKSALETKEAMEYASAMKVVNAKCVEYRNEAIKNAQALKIIIPDSLRSTYELVFQAGKKK